MRGHHHPLHPATRMALADVRSAGGKAIVLLNRRGWSNFLSCRGCGHVWMCPNCEVALVLHRAAGQLACHHCGHRRRGAEPLRGVRLGGGGPPRRRHRERRARAARGVRRQSFPVFRLDADAAAGKDRLARTLQAFEAAPPGVLVGTQMVAKGHDFADVALGVVLDADQTLRFPDFRAEERTFALVTQLAGRVGRGRRIGPGAAPPRHAGCSSRRSPRTRASIAFAAAPRLRRVPGSELGRRAARSATRRSGR